MSSKTMAAYIAKRRQRQVTGTSQTVKARKDQVFNSAGGATFAVSKWDRLYRFLILGSEGGTFYVSEQKLTKDNAKNVVDCIKEDGLSTVDIIVEVSKSGRAPKNDPALLALALCTDSEYADAETRGYAMAMLPEVARTGTHLFHFMEYANAVRGWGRLLREGVANWYSRLDTDRLALQIIKYQQRDGWSHRDALRLAHPNPKGDATRNNLYKYIVKGRDAINFGDPMPGIIIAFERAKTASTTELVKLITDYDLTREMVPTEKLNEVAVWEALLQKMPATAMIRNLGKMTNIGLLRPGSTNTAHVVNTLTDREILKKARVHPLQLLVALHQYGQGKGDKGSLSWSPLAQVKNALDEGFYQAFGALESSDKNTMLAIDISGSMIWDSAKICGTSLKAREGAAAMAMVSLRTEPNAFVTAFSAGDWRGAHGYASGITHVTGINRTSKLDNVVNTMSNMAAGSTDCALPMLWALKNKVKIDTFAIYTDSETWAGQIHPFEALKQYRDAMGIPARVVVVGMASNGFTIADPKDPGMLDVVGFDTATPQVIADFSAGRF